MIREPHISYLWDCRAPLPDPLPDVRLGPGPAYHKFSYYDPDARTIWLLLTDWHSPYAFYHELGHCFDRTHLNDVLRHALVQERIVGRRGRPWFWGRWNPLRHVLQPNEEFFADAYAEVARGRVRSRLKAVLREARR